MKSIFQRIKTHNITRDLAALYGAHIARYLFVYLTIPYLARVLGVELLGVLLFAQAYGIFVSQSVEYGFAFTGTKQVAINRSNDKRLSDILNNILFAQFVVFLFFLLVTLFLMLLIPQFKDYPYLIIVTIFYAGAQGMNLFWYFRGVGKAVVVAKLELFSKMITISLIFITVDSKDDILFVMMSFLVGSLVSLFSSLYLLYDKLNIGFSKFNGCYKTLCDSWNAFLIRVGGSFIADGNVLLCGSLLPSKEFGYFSAAFKIASAIRGLFAPIVDAFFPHIAESLSREPESAKRLNRKILPIMVAFGGGLGMLMFFFSEFLVYLMLGKEFSESVILVQYFALLPILISVVHTYGTQWMVPIGRERRYSRIVLVSGFIGLLASVIVTPRLLEVGAVFAILLSYLLIAVLTIISLNRDASNVQQ
jgi:polysaccharide transporter, PST family